MFSSDPSKWFEGSYADRNLYASASAFGADSVVLANPYRKAAVAKIRSLVCDNNDARDKLVALCIKNPGISEAIAEDADITVGEMINLLPQPGKPSLNRISHHIRVQF